MVFENGVKNIQAPAYNGAHTVYELGFNRLASQCKFLQFELHNNV